MIKRLLVRDRIRLRDRDDLPRRLLCPDRGVDVFFVKGRQILPVDEGECLRHVHIAIEIDVAVRRMIVGPVEIKVLLVGEVRDVLRLAAGLDAIGCMRIEGAHRLALKDRLCRGVGALHFIVDDAI